MACLDKVIFLDKIKIAIFTPQTFSINMKTTLSISSVLAISTIAISSISTSAFAKDGAFVSGSVGASIGKESGNAHSSLANNGVSYGGAIGYNKNKWSFLASYDKRSLTENDFVLLENLDTSIYLASAIYNFKPLANKVQLYIGGGLGVANTSAQSTNPQKSCVTMTLASATAMQLQGGLKYPVHKNIDIFADLRYTSVSNSTLSVNGITGITKIGLTISSLNIGATYRF